MNQIKSFLVELGYHEQASASFRTQGAQLYLSVEGMSEAMSRKLVKKYFTDAVIYAVREKETIFKLF
jgi:hypothetical protein